jgi:hypothetical protein
MADLSRNVRLMGLLFRQPNIDLNIRNQRSVTPLMIAVLREYLPLIELLIHDSRADVSAIANGESTLMTANQQNRHPIVELLIQRPDLEVNALHRQDHPLYLLIELDDVKSCRGLLQHPVRLGKGHYWRTRPLPGGRFPISVSEKFAMPRPGEQTTRITK